MLELREKKPPEQELLEQAQGKSPCSPIRGCKGKPPLHPGVGDITTSQPLGQDRRSILEVARKVWAPTLSYPTKITQGGDGAQFAGNKRRRGAPPFHQRDPTAPVSHWSSSTVISADPSSR